MEASKYKCFYCQDVTLANVILTSTTRTLVRGTGVAMLYGLDFFNGFLTFLEGKKNYMKYINHACNSHLNWCLNCWIIKQKTEIGSYYLNRAEFLLFNETICIIAH